MDFAVASFAELVAPPPRALAVSATSAEADLPSFEAQLEIEETGPTVTPEASTKPIATLPEQVAPLTLQFFAELETAPAQAQAADFQAPPMSAPLPPPVQSAPQLSLPAQTGNSAAPPFAPPTESNRASAESEDKGALAPVQTVDAEASAPAPPPTAIAPIAAASAMSIASPPNPTGAAQAAAAPLASPVQSARAPAPRNANPAPAPDKAKTDAGAGEAKPATPHVAAALKADIAHLGAAADAPDAPAARADVLEAAFAQAAAPSASQAGAHTQQAILETGAVRAAPATAQLGREIVRRFNGESTRFEMRLDPPELGRIEVRLDLSRDHRVTALISADNPQALTDLVRHARELQQMLESAGLELSDTGLSFDLRQGDGEATETNHDSNSGGGDDPADEGLSQDAIVTARSLGLEHWRGLRIDVMA